MSPWRYLFVMTLWTVLMPAMGGTLLLCALFSLSPAIVVTLPVGLLLGYILVRFTRWMAWNLKTAAEEGIMPESFAVRYLPLVLPVFYGLVVLAMAYQVLLRDDDIADWFVLCSLPHYALINIVVGLISSFDGYMQPSLVMAWTSLALAALGAAIAWGYMGALKLPAAKNRARGAAVFAAVTAVFGAAIYSGHAAYRENILPQHPREGGETIVRDEEGGHGYRRRRADKTDLEIYRPFTANNQLVKIDSPTLRIDGNYPRMHGALALFPIYAAAAEAIYEGYITREGYRVQKFVDAGTSPQAFDALLSGEADMAFMLHPSEAQMAEAKKQGKTLEITPLGREAFVFFVSHVNPVDDLSSAQIRDIYAKKIRRWSEVGGKDEAILPFQRPAGSGSQTAMERFMGRMPLALPVREEYQADMGGIVNRVADYRNYGNAIGYSFRYYVTTMFRHDGVKVIAVDGVQPTVENIRSGAYPLAGELAVVTVAGNKNPHVPELIAWFLSPQGQRLIEAVGYVGIRNEELGMSNDGAERRGPPVGELGDWEMEDRILRLGNGE